MCSLSIISTIIENNISLKQTIKRKRKVTQLFLFLHCKCFHIEVLKQMLLNLGDGLLIFYSLDNYCIQINLINSRVLSQYLVVNLVTGETLLIEHHSLASDLSLLLLAQLSFVERSSEGVVVVLRAPNGCLDLHQLGDGWEEAVLLLSRELLVQLAHIQITHIHVLCLRALLQGLFETISECIIYSFRSQSPHRLRSEIILLFLLVTSGTNENQ